MAKRNYLVEGLSGVGKSSVYEELIRRGYKAISTDRAWKVHADPDTDLPGRPIHSTRCGTSKKLSANSKARNQKCCLFVEAAVIATAFCRISRRYSTSVSTMTPCVAASKSAPIMNLASSPRKLELMLRLNRSDEKPAGAIDVDATQPLDQVVDELLRLANCRTVTSDSTLTPWSKRGSAIGQSFVISESALPIVQAAATAEGIVRGTSDEFWDVLGRETITRIEYAWSGYVLATLLPYLDEQGIDLMHSDHDEVASTISQAREGSVFVLTSDHRERYLARLDPSAFDGAVLRHYYEESNETAAEGVEYAMLDGIAFFRDTLAPLESAIVAVFIIG